MCRSWTLRLRLSLQATKARPVQEEKQKAPVVENGEGLCQPASSCPSPPVPGTRPQEQPGLWSGSSRCLGSSLCPIGQRCSCTFCPLWVKREVSAAQRAGGGGGGGSSSAPSLFAGEVGTETKSLLEQLRGEALKFHKPGERREALPRAGPGFVSPGGAVLTLCPSPRAAGLGAVPQP